MPVDPELVGLLRGVNEAPPLSSATPGHARELFRRLTQLAASVSSPVEIGCVENIEVDGGAGPLSARVYRPRGAGPRPTLAFFHGGGFTIGDVASYDLQCRRLCHEIDGVIVSTDYRLAPENPFPAAVEDAPQRAGSASTSATWAETVSSSPSAVTARVATSRPSCVSNYATQAPRSPRSF